MKHDAIAGFPTGYVHSIIFPGCNICACYARFHREYSDGTWIRGSEIEKSFDDELIAVQWLRGLGCPDDRITIFRLGGDHYFSNDCE